MGSDSTSNPLSTFSAKLDSYRAQVDHALVAELQQRADSPFFDPLVTMLRDGKRLRPILLLLAYESVDGRKGDPLPASVAVELAHMESLIHDDIIDGDIVRRKAASFHASYGHETALLSADFILSLILGIMARYADPRITTTLATATAQMCEGELREINTHATNRVMPPDIYLDIVAKKTAALFEAAATMGAVIGGAPRTHVDALAAYARALGIAYQIHDDIVDWTQDQSIAIALPHTHRSQDAYLHEMAARHIREARARLQPLNESHAKRCLDQLAVTIDSKAIHYL